jgi:hypothetical protein
LAVFFAIKLSKETRGEKYWFFLLVATVSMAVFHIVRHPWPASMLSEETVNVIIEITEIVGAFSMAYAAFGLYTSMKRIREKISKEL